MVLLHFFAALRRGELSAVATFDHGTGAAAASAVEFVVGECLRRGIPVIAGRSPLSLPSPTAASESVLREARWAYLRAVAEERQAVIVTAHSRDDQAETVAMRILRGASARGLAAMVAPTPDVRRPLLGVSRAEISRVAVAERVPYVDDPSNEDRDYLRNRLRADLLAAVERARPGFTDELVAIGERAAQWRAALADLADSMGVQMVGGAVVSDARVLASLTEEGLAVLWPELAGRASVVLDRRGIERLVAWTPVARPGQRMPLSGGAMVERTANTFVLRASGSAAD